MSQKVILLIVVALIAVGFITFALFNKSSPPPEVKKIQVLVAVSDIPAGGFVREGKDIGWRDWQKENITESMISSENDKIDQFNGAVARRSISAGEPISRNTLVKANEGGFLSAVLAPGTRAVSISVNPTSGNAGFVFPGDRVDLILTHRVSMSNADAPSGTSRNVLASETFVENARVVAIDQMLDNPDNKAVLAKTITLEVTPKQAEKINVASGLGTISVSLRSLGNTPVAAVKPGTPPAPAVKPNPDGTQDDTVTQDSDVSKLIDMHGDGRTRVKVIRGNSSEQVDFLKDAQ